MTSLSARTGQVDARAPERMRDLQHVVLTLLDGTEVRGILHRAQGTRTLDYLNRQAEAFVAMTEAELVRHGRSEQVAFIAINKAHIVRLTETRDER